MAFSSSWLFNSTDSPFFFSSIDRVENIVEGVPDGLVRKPIPELLLLNLEGEILLLSSVGEGNDDLKLKVGLTISSLGLMYCLLSWSLEVVVGVCLFGGMTLLLLVVAISCWAALLGSDGPVSLCTTSLKEFVSVCTNVVKGLQPAVTWVSAGFSMMVNYSFHLRRLSFTLLERIWTCKNISI
ncbi:hypothetical protein TorRG33x02_188370 [Trema orientale]|uniref:Transmembrane protein n=1 Tax=Trema orientale TaxID=63057 RepID=A0A2P5EIQ8_TREOI|nr:hypothetical protein TorRG33x02_188370 [Trema orientale]